LGSGTVFPPTGKTIRVDVVRERQGDVEGIPLYRTECKGIDFPIMDEVRAGDVVIVSLIVKNAIHDRRNSEFWTPGCTYVSPGTLKRDEEGNVIGCEGFDL